MPEIARFYGLIIKMFFRIGEHNPPHFHALYGEYMPITNTDVIGLANASAQQGYASMYSYKVVNPSTIVQGKILGTF